MGPPTVLMLIWRMTAISISQDLNLHGNFARVLMRDVIQLAIIQTGDIHVPIHARFVNDFSTAHMLLLTSCRETYSQPCKG